MHNCQVSQKRTLQMLSRIGEQCQTKIPHFCRDHVAKEGSLKQKHLRTCGVLSPNMRRSPLKMRRRMKLSAPVWHRQG